MVQSYSIEEPLFVILVVFLVLAWVSCLLRAWVKLVVMKKVTADDYLMLCGIIFYTGYSVAGLYGVTHGVSTLGHGLTLEQASIGLRAWWLCETLYAPVTLAVRTSVAVFLLQIAVQRVHRRIIVVIIVAFWLVTIPLFFVVVFQCRPVSYFWRQPFPSVPRGTCLDGHVLFVVSVVHSAISACCDWALGILPVFMLWRVRLNAKTKLTLSLLLGMGIFAGIALIIRITYVRPFNVSVNFLYETLNVANWSILEPSVCIIAGCLATLRPLFSCLGWATISRSSRKSRAVDRPTQSRTRSRTGCHSNRGGGSASAMGRADLSGLSAQSITASGPSRPLHAFLSSRTAVDETSVDAYELMAGFEKRPSMLAQRVTDDNVDNDDNNGNDDRDDKNDNNDNGGAHRATSHAVRRSTSPTTSPSSSLSLPLYPAVASSSHASVHAIQTTRLVSPSSPRPTSSPPQQSHQRLSQWHPNIMPPPSSSPALSTSCTPPPAPSSASPTPCHIVVEKSTRVEYMESAKAPAETVDTAKTATAAANITASASVLSLPTGAGASAVYSMQRDPLECSIGTRGLVEQARVLHGAYAVDISGPHIQGG